MTQPLVSVCIPAYNGAAFIGQTLESVIAQSYENVEILVGNNCSTDATGEIIDRFCARDPRVVHVRHEKNLGYVGNLNTLFAMAKGEYVAFYHADDVYQPTLVQKEVEILDANPEVGAVFCKAKNFCDDLEQARRCKQRFLKPGGAMKQGDGYLWGGMDAFLPIFLREGNFIVCPSFMTRRGALERAGLWSDAYVGPEDLNLWLRYLKNGVPLAVITDYLIYYRKHTASGTATLRAISPGFQRDNHFRLLDDFLGENPTAAPAHHLRAYRKRKAKIMLKVAGAYREMGDTANYREYVDRSLKACRLPFLTKRGLVQRFPQLAFRLGLP
ncbi:glycosyltransferase family 2 protein [Geomonas terrae]|uniref:Glycosyltransferase family 2 protein n=1 Tax=Geomonas terrae TaxID=2562681 RepID=A0A4S1C9W7_9BACT|nr:glycosyltransferase family 2 protein [Geomonas terrae]TGU70059.1 glycosyltransferase family 2 protein [Geomonas terrae]